MAKAQILAKGNKHVFSSKYLLIIVLILYNLWWKIKILKWFHDGSLTWFITCWPKLCQSTTYRNVSKNKGQDIFSSGWAHLVYLHSCSTVVFSVKDIQLQPIKASFALCVLCRYFLPEVRFRVCIHYQCGFNHRQQPLYVVKQDTPLLEQRCWQRCNESKVKHAGRKTENVCSLLFQSLLFSQTKPPDNNKDELCFNVRQLLPLHLT